MLKKLSLVALLCVLAGVAWACLAVLGFSPSPVSFPGTQVSTSSSPISVTVTNESTIAAPLGSIAITGTNSADFSQTNTCGTVIAANSTCSVSVTFTPSITGAETASLNVPVTGEPAFMDTLNGTGVTGFFVSACTSSLTACPGQTTGASDSNAGTLAAPFATVQQCQTAMHGSMTVKTCYIRAGTYTGSGTGYTTVSTSGTGYTATSSIYLTNSDNGETISEYPSDFPANGISNAIFDGGASAWSASNSSSCPSAGPPTAVTRGVLINGGSNITISNLQFRNYCWAAIAIHGGAEWSGACLPATPSDTSATGNTIKNNYLHEISWQVACNGDGSPRMGIVHIETADLAISSNTVSHNAIFDGSSNGTRIVALGSASGSGGWSSTTVDHNYVWNTAQNTTDTGAIYFYDNCNGSVRCGSNSSTVSYNYIMTSGQDKTNGGGAGENNNGLYDDDFVTNITKNGNVVAGTITQYALIHGAGCNGGTCNDVNTGNIFDVGDVSTQEPRAWYTVSNDGATNGPYHIQNNITIANTASCADINCMVQQNGPSGTISNNDYWNYGSGGNTILNNSATNGGDTGPNNVDAFGNTTSRCPGGNINSWGYVIPSGNSVFSSPVSFPAQPTGWATPGFWGPPGFVLPHNGTTPSYGPTC